MHRIVNRDPPPSLQGFVYHPPFGEIRFRLNSRTLVGDMYRIQLAFNKFKRAMIKVIPNYFK